MVDSSSLSIFIDTLMMVLYATDAVSYLYLPLFYKEKMWGLACYGTSVGVSPKSQSNFIVFALGL
jgi:hypothetical protein